MSANRLIAQLALEGIIITEDQAKDYIRKYFQKYAKVKVFHKTVETAVRNRLESSTDDLSYVTTLGGRRRRLDRAYLTDPLTEYPAITQAINAIIQGGVSDLIKIAMVDIQQEFMDRGWLDPETGIWDAYLQGQIHDEIICECKDELAEHVKTIIQEKMLLAGQKYKIKVPMLSDAHIVDSLAKG